MYSSKKSGKIKTNYKREYVNSSADIDFDFAGPTIHGSATTEYVLSIVCVLCCLEEGNGRDFHV